MKVRFEACSWSIEGVPVVSFPYHTAEELSEEQFKQRLEELQTVSEGIPQVLGSPFIHLEKGVIVVTVYNAYQEC